MKIHPERKYKNKKPGMFIKKKFVQDHPREKVKQQTKTKGNSSLLRMSNVSQVSKTAK